MLGICLLLLEDMTNLCHGKCERSKGGEGDTGSEGRQRAEMGDGVGIAVILFGNLRGQAHPAARVGLDATGERIRGLGLEDLRALPAFLVAFTLNFQPGLLYRYDCHSQLSAR